MRGGTSRPLASERKIEPPFHRIEIRRPSEVGLLKGILPDCLDVPYLRTNGPHHCRFDVGRPQHMLRHVKPHPIVHIDPLAATGSVTMYGDGKGWCAASCNAARLISGKKHEAGQIANHRGPNVGQLAF